MLYHTLEKSTFRLKVSRYRVISKCILELEDCLNPKCITWAFCIRLQMNVICSYSCIPGFRGFVPAIFRSVFAYRPKICAFICISVHGTPRILLVNYRFISSGHRPITEELWRNLTERDFSFKSLPTYSSKFLIMD